MVFHGRVDRALAARAVTIADPTWVLAQNTTTPSTTASAGSTETPSTMIHVQQTVNVHQPSVQQRTIGTQTDLEVEL